MKTPRIAHALAAACVLTFTLGRAHAQETTATIWHEIAAGSASGNGLSNETLGNAGAPAVAVDGANIYVAWESSTSEIFVLKWTGNAWVQVGPHSASDGGISGNAGHSRFPSVAVGLDGSPVVAWLDDSSGNWEVYLRKFNSQTNAWGAIAGSGDGAGVSQALGSIAAPEAAQPAIRIGTSNQIFVAWAKNATERHVFVSVPTETTWNTLDGSVDLAESEYSSPAATTPPPQYLGATRPDLVLGVDNVPIVSYVTASSVSSGDVHVRRWTGTAWAPYGTGAATNAGISGVGPHSPNGFTLSTPRLGVAPNGVIHASWLYADATQQLIHVRRSSESGWTDVAPALAVNAVAVGGTALGFAVDRSPIVAWTATTAAASVAANTEIYVKKLAASTSNTGVGVWQEYATGSATGGGVSANAGGSAWPVLAFPRGINTVAGGATVLAWLDASDSTAPLATQVYVRRVAPATILTPGKLQFRTTALSVGEGSGTATIEVTRTEGSDGEVTVAYATVALPASAGTAPASAGSDYTSVSGTLTFANGVISQSFTVPILEDTAVEPRETLGLRLSNPTGGAGLGLAAATLAIEDNDSSTPPPAAGRLAFKLATFAVGEGSGQAAIEVTRTDGKAGEVTVAYQTEAASGEHAATADADYTPVSGVLTFADGVISRTFVVPILEDTLAEGRETLVLRLSNPTGGATLGNAGAVLAIDDNDTTVPPPSAGQLTFKVSTFVAGEGIGRAVIEVVRAEGSAGEVTVAYQTEPSTGEHPATTADYTPVSGTLTFAAGVTSRTFEVPILEDTEVEPRETVGLRLSAPTGGATLGRTPAAVLVIEDNDAPSANTIQFAPAEYRIAENGGAVQLRVTRSGDTSVAATVEYLTLPSASTETGIATPGADFTPVSGQLTFAPGDLFKTISVPIKLDNIVEPNEVFAVGLRNAAGASLGAAAAARVVIESSPNASPGVLAFAAAEFRVIENAGAAEITVVRKEGSTGEISATYSTAAAANSEHAATPDVDYTSTSGTLTFADGETRKTFSVPIIDDAITEGAEIVGLVLTSPIGGAALSNPGAVASLIIADDDQPAGHLQFAEGQVRVREGATSVTLVVTRQDGAAGEVSVPYATADGTAKAGSDYTATTGSLTFAPGQLSGAITIPIRHDTAKEAAQTFTVTLGTPTGGATLGTPKTATVTIVDSEAAGILQFAKAEYVIAENGRAVTIVVTRTEGFAGAVSVNYATADGTALVDADYTATSGVLNFAAGVKSKTFTVPIIDDTVPEPAKAFSVLLSEPTGGAVLGPRNLAKITITDNDEASTLQFAVGAVSVNETTAGATISVVRRGSTAGALTVKYATSDGTARAGEDYTAVSGTLEFAPRQTVKKFVVPILRDTVAEGTEDVVLTLSEPTGGAMLGVLATATLSILDTRVESGSVQFSAPQLLVNEKAGSATVTVTRTGATQGAISVKYATAAGTATETDDFTPVSGTLTFAAGEKTKTFTVPIVADDVIEGPETILLDLTTPTGGALLGTPSHAVLTIVEQTNSATGH